MNKIEIMIVEDETIIALDIKRALIKIGYKVVNHSSNYTDAMNFIKDNTPDIIIMDINLVGSLKGGIETTKDIKEQKDIPVIYLTSDSDMATIDRAVKTNPIGYLTKPFKREELKSTITLAMHKMDKDFKNKTSYEPLGHDYFYDKENNNIYYREIPIKLSNKEKLFIEIMLKQPRGKIRSFEYLLDILWGDSNVTESAIRTLIYRLRSKLEHKFIHTIKGFGCTFFEENKEYNC